MRLTILSPERRLLENTTVEEVTLTTSEGQIQILPGHAAMLGTLDTGVFRYRAPGETTASEGIITTGFFEVTGDAITVMAEVLELKGEIDVERAKRAQKLAEDALKDADLDIHKFSKYQLKLQRSLVRQQLAGRMHAGE